jgi:hypothetical protein
MHVSITSGDPHLTSFSDLDSNGNGVLDDADTYVRLESANLRRRR